MAIVQEYFALHMDQIFEAARGILVPASDAHSEDEAIECVLLVLKETHGEADKRVLESYMAAQTWDWWDNYLERELLSDLVRRSDLRKRWGGSAHDRRRTTLEEGLRVARPLLAAIPDEITLDAVGEYESVARLVAALLMPPMGEPSPEMLQRFVELAESIPVFKDGLRYFNADFDNADAALYRPDIRWQKQSGIMHRGYRNKVKVPSHSPIKPALLLRNLQIQFVIQLLTRVGIRPRGTRVSGCDIVGVALGLSEDTVKGIWGMKFTVEMRRQSQAVAQRLGLTDSTEA